MGDNTFDLSGPALSEDHITALESQLGISLPGDYRQFLLVHNGGALEKAFFALKDKGTRWVDWLCWVDRNLADPSEESEVETLAFAQFRDGNIVPSDSLIIGVSCRDDLILLFLRGDRRGQVYLKCEDDLPLASREELAKAPHLGLHHIADSFSDFLNMLQEDDAQE